MSPDLALLESLRTHHDDQLGIEERFETFELGSGRTVGVLSLPIGRRRPIGWLICHSFGSEHWHLSATDVSVARALSANGFPVLRFHSQGYGDSERMDVTPTVSTHVQDAIDAATTLRSLTGVGEVGLIGSRFGGAVARLAAKQVDAPLLVLVDPVINGRRYIRNLMRSKAIVELTTGHPEPETAVDEHKVDPSTLLRVGGAINVRGFVVTPEAVEEITSLDLMGLPEPIGRVLLVQVSRGPGPATPLVHLAEHLTRNGDDVASAVVSGPFAALFGDGHFRPTDGEELGDALAGINREIASTIVEWAIESRPREPRSEG